jgi:hypothetical protein
VVLKQSLSFSSDAVRAPQLKASVSQTQVEREISVSERFFLNKFTLASRRLTEDPLRAPG